MKYLAVGWMSVSCTRSGSLASECWDGWWEKTGRGWSPAQLYWHWREANYRKLSKPSLPSTEENIPDQTRPASFRENYKYYGIIISTFICTVSPSLLISHARELELIKNTWEPMRLQTHLLHSYLHCIAIVFLCDMALLIIMVLILSCYPGVSII